MSKITQEQILNQLSQIIDPDFNQNIVQLKFVKNIIITPPKVEVTIELTTPACPVKESFQKQAQTLLQSLPGIKEVQVNMTAKTPSRPYAFKANSKQQTNLGKVANVIGVASCKGGVGKSTIAALLSCELSHRGHKVGLFDTDIFGPSLPTLFELGNTNIYLENDLIQPHSINKNLKVMSFGFLLKEAPAIMRGAMVSNYLMELIHKVNWESLDYLIIDMPPGTGDIQLTLSQNINIHGVVMVSTSHLLSIVDVARGILMFEKVKVPIISIVENMSYFTCEQCSKKHYLFQKSQVSFEKRFGIANHIEVPFLDSRDLNFKSYQTKPINQKLCDKIIKQYGKNNLSSLNRPPQYSYDDKRLTLIYPDQKYVISYFTLRSSCSCALCKDEMTGQSKLSPSSVPINIQPTEMFPLGNYALSINWNDGHTSGIYPYHLIQSLAEKSTEKNR